MPNQSIGEPGPNCTSHDTQTLDMRRNFGKRIKKQGNIRQGSCGYQPRRALRLGHQRSTHRHDSVLLPDRRRSSWRQQHRAIDTGNP